MPTCRQNRQRGVSAKTGSITGSHQAAGKNRPIRPKLTVSKRTSLFRSLRLPLKTRPSTMRSICPGPKRSPSANVVARCPQCKV
jgi:hypothetical protein